MRAILPKTVLAAAVAAGLVGCQHMAYQINIVEPSGVTTDIYASTWLPPWTEIEGREIALMTGVDASGNWYVATGETMDRLMQNPAIAKAVVDGFVAGLGKAVALGLGMP